CLAGAATRGRRRPVQSLEADRAGGDAGLVGAGERGRSHRLVLQRELPVAGHAALRAHHRSMVLVHGPIHRAARPQREKRAHRAAGQHLRSVLEVVPGVHFHHPRLDRPRAREDGPGPGARHHLVGVGRAATGVMVVSSLLWIPVIQSARGPYDYLQGVQGYLAPPIFTVFVFGIFNRRLNSKGCLAALIVGFVLGVFRLALDTPVSLHLAGFADGYAPGSFLWIVNNLYFQYYSVFIFVVSVVVMFVVIYVTAPPG